MPSYIGNYPLGIIQANTIPDGSITTSALAANAVTTPKIAEGAVVTADVTDNAITTVKLAANAVTTGILADNTITTVKLANGAVTTSILADSAVTIGKLANTFAQPGLQQTFTATQIFTGNASAIAVVLSDAAETVTANATALTGNVNYDITTQSVLYYTANATGNWTVNLRASSGTSLNTAMSSNQSVTVAVLATQGATAYFNSAVQVDGAAANVIRWQGGAAPTAGNASGIDSYSYTIIKTAASTFTVLASQTRFG
jgi:hypothetical protein